VPPHPSGDRQGSTLVRGLAFGFEVQVAQVPERVLTMSFVDLSIGKLERELCRRTGHQDKGGCYVGYGAWLC